MPHKRNPVLTENLTGLARMVRSAVVPAMENVALWHERDISHSSVERMIGPDATITLDFALARLTGVIDKLVIYPDNMIANMNKFRGLVHSQRVLLALTQAGVSREDAYRLVQRNAMKVWKRARISGKSCWPTPEVTRRPSRPRRSRRSSTLGYHTKHVDTIFARVFAEGWMPQAGNASKIQQFNFPSAALCAKVIVFCRSRAKPFSGATKTTRPQQNRGDATCASRPSWPPSS